MQAAIVMTIALAGLGCQNKSIEWSDAPPAYGVIGAVETNPYPSYTSPSSYSGYYQRSDTSDVSDVYPTHWDAVRSTFCSFLIGRDPGVTTVAEIEASVYGD